MEDVLIGPAGRLGHGAPPAAGTLGQRLVADGLLAEEQLERALERQRAEGVRLGQVLMAEGWIRPLDFYRALAAHLGLPFVNLVDDPPEERLFDPVRIEEYTRRQYLPWRTENGLILAVAEPDETLFDDLRATYGSGVRFAVTSKLDILWSIQKLGWQRLAQNAVLGRAAKTPEYSAAEVLSRGQMAVLALAAAALAACLAWNPLQVVLALHYALGGFLVGGFLLRCLLVWNANGRLHRCRVTPEEMASADERALPLYSVLVPLYRDAAVVPLLAQALRSLEYPRSRLDIKLVLEADDRETIEACKQAGLEGNVELILVPPLPPRTKPKALNYALPFCRGRLVTIYDAEDIPDPGQLKKAALAFAKAPWDVVCLQAKLNYFNWDENWLTRMFTLEYSLWFDWYLPGLERLRIPIPLGGTSNHFRIEVIRGVGAWDPFNVTEDADLGMRFTMSGWRVGILESTTLEEANTELWNWIRQRSRWVKGYLQTWLVYMRNPIRTYRRLGWRGFLGLQAFVGGAVAGPLAFPPLAGLYLFWLVTRWSALDPLFPPTALAMSLLLLLMGNGLLIYFHMLAAWQRRKPKLVFYALFLPAYYLMMAVAAWKAVAQLITKPHYWEKTEHGLTRVQTSEGGAVHA